MITDSMVPSVLGSALQRARRADEHIADLKHLLATFHSEQLRTWLAHLQAHGWPRPGIDLRLTAFAPMSIGIRIGEACYNLRTALDYLVFEIAKLDSGAPQDFTQFPIKDTPEKFRKWIKQARSKGIDAGHITAFERLQPYQGCDWTGALRDLSNKDKHRELPKLGGRSNLIFYVQGEAEFARALPVFRAPHPQSGQVMDIKVDFQSTIAFDDGTPVLETLEKIKTGVDETLADFKPEFET